MRLNNRITVVLAAVVAIALGAGAWLLGVSPQLDAAAASERQVADAKAQAAELQAQVVQLAADKAKMPRYAAELDLLKKSVPATANTAALLRALGEMASSTGVTLTTFDPGDVMAYKPPGTDTSTAVPPQSGSATSASPTPDASPTSSASPSSTVGPGEYTDASVTAANFELIPLTIGVTGSPEAVLSFLDALRDGDRLVAVTGVTEATNEKTSGKDLIVTGSAFAYTGPPAAATTAAANG